MANEKQSLVTRDLRTHTRSSLRKSAWQIQSSKFALDVNANGTQSDVADHPGEVQAVILCASAVGSGMTIDVQVNGASVLAGGTPFTHGAAHPAKTEISIPVARGKLVKPGEIISVIRGSFTAGASVVKVLY